MKSIVKKVLAVDNVHRLALALTGAIYLAIFVGLLRIVIWVEKTWLAVN